MKTLKIDVTKINIEEVFGFESYDDYVEAILGNDEHSQRVKGLTKIFLTLLESGNPDRATKPMFVMSYMWKLILEKLSSRDIGTPAHIIAYFNDALTAKEIVEIAEGIMAAQDCLANDKVGV